MDLLERPRDEACRVVALEYLDEAVEAKGRLGSDPEGLHDLRVALRRLRSTLRAWRQVLGRPLRGRARRALRRIVDATGDARDAEVLLELLKNEGTVDGWLVDELHRRKLEGYALVEKRLAGFPRLEARLRRRLSRVQIDLLNPHPLKHALADLIDDHTDDVEDDLFVLRSSTQMEEAHEARISVKRLRYLIEPYKQEDGIAKLVKPLKALQDLLGYLHDTHMGLAEVAAVQKEQRPLELAARLELRQHKLFAAYEGEWMGELSVVAQARALAQELRKG